MNSATLSPALTQVLQAGRNQFNVLVANACRAQPGFDTAVVQEFLSGPLNALAIQAAQIDPARLNGLMMAAFDAALTLQLRGKSELPLVQMIWREVLPACLPLAMQQPRDTLGSIFNAALNLLAVNGARSQQWGQEMTRLAGRCSDLVCLRGLGQVLAWRCGAAHFRSSALAVLANLPADLAADAFVLASSLDWPLALQRMQQNPWFDPAQPASRGLRVMYEVGGFTGFGGPFASPPEVRVYADCFVLRSAERYWYLCADAFGAVLHAGSAEEFEAGRPGANILEQQGNEFRLGTQRCTVDLPPERLQLAGGQFAAAVSSPHSYFIRLLALV